MNAAIIVKTKGDVQGKVMRAVEALRYQSITPLLEQATVDRLALDVESVSIEEMRQRADFVVVLGGDGTLLYAARLFRLVNIPILGFNLGRVGFIMELDFDRIEDTIREYVEGKLIKRQRMKIAGTLSNDKEILFEEEALNEIVLSKGAPSRMIEITISIDGKYLTNYRSDGLIISTPTGSTGYTISAGGPIVHPDLDNIILTPICPHALSLGSIVLPCDSVIEVKLESDSESYVTFDGQILHHVRMGDILRITKSAQSCNLVLGKGQDYYQLLRNKLGWGGGKC